MPVKKILSGFRVIFWTFLESCCCEVVTQSQSYKRPTSALGEWAANLHIISDCIAIDCTLAPIPYTKEKQRSLTHILLRKDIEADAATIATRILFLRISIASC
jgi:hypothetical protein